MSRHEHPFKRMAAFFLVGLVSGSVCFAAGEAPKYKKIETGLYRDVFDQNLYYEGTNLLHLDRFYRLLFRKKVRAKNVNVFDEVPDSSFFTNRHARRRLSKKELVKGAYETPGPDSSKDFVVTRGKFEGLHPGFFIRDARGDEYILKFDPIDNLELATAAENIASRFYYAIGYNVPQYSIVTFDPSKLVPAAGAKIYDDTGFKKELTKERLEESLLFIPQNSDGQFRASASKILAGENKGAFSFGSRRKEDPDDLINHRDRREIRALQVFASWLNNYDVRESNTLDMLVTEDGRKVLKHYLIDFNATLGAGSDEAKPPMFVHEHMIDYGEMLKAYFAFGLWEKPWQKRWREGGERIIQSRAVGYFDNRFFDPAKFKTQLPYYAFKDLTRADGFWAAKVIMAFSDEDIREMVKAGELSRKEDADYIAKTLAERRDIIGRYWFRQANPLDLFDFKDNRLFFRDLMLDYGFESAEGTSYLVDVIGRNAKRRSKIASLKLQEPSIPLEEKWFSENDRLDLRIRTIRAEASEQTPYVLVTVNSRGVSRIIHED